MRLQSPSSALFADGGLEAKLYAVFAQLLKTLRIERDAGGYNGCSPAPPQPDGIRPQAHEAERLCASLFPGTGCGDNEAAGPCIFYGCVSEFLDHPGMGSF